MPNIHVDIATLAADRYCRAVRDVHTYFDLVGTTASDLSVKKEVAMSRRRGYSSQSTFSRIHDIGGADLALRYHEISERSRLSESQSTAERESSPVAPRLRSNGSQCA